MHSKPSLGFASSRVVAHNVNCCTCRLGSKWIPGLPLSQRVAIERSLLRGRGASMVSIVLDMSESAIAAF